MIARRIFPDYVGARLPRRAESSNAAGVFVASRLPATGLFQKQRKRKNETYECIPQRESSFRPALDRHLVQLQGDAQLLFSFSERTVCHDRAGGRRPAVAARLQ